MAEANDDKLVEAILASGVKIPPMPKVLIDVLALAREDQAGAREYAAAIGHDPALAGAVFRVAGSPVMGLRAKVETLEKAITVLGLRTTLAVVRSEALRGALHDPALVAAMNVLWQRMNTMAELMMAMVRRARLRSLGEDLVYQVGIFHDCGVAVLCRRDPGYAAAFHAGAPWPDLALLDAAHQTSHTVVGQMVARNWQLPQDVAQAIRQHHDAHPEELPERVRALCVLVHLASHLLARRAGGSDAEWLSVWMAHGEALFSPLGCDLAELEAELLSPG